MTPRPLKSSSTKRNAAPKKTHKSKVPKSLLKSIISLDSVATKDSVEGGSSAFDAEFQRAPRRALNFTNFLSKKQESLDAGSSVHQHLDSLAGGKGEGKRVKTGEEESKKKKEGANKPENTVFKVGKELTKKRTKKQEFHKKKQESIKAKKQVPIHLEDLLRLKGSVRHGERNEDIPKFTVVPRKVIKKEMDHQLPPAKPKSKDDHQKSTFPSTSTTTDATTSKVGRSRKLKFLPEAEKRALLIERERMIALYRSKKTSNTNNSNK